jgi:hypothetical protein
LYDSLRPRILHEPRLDVLCGLCTVLQALISLDRDDVPGGDQANGDATSELGGETNAQPGSEGQLRFGQLLETILQDVQTRLVFRAQAVIQTEVLHYISTAQDLDYPAKLKGVRGLSLWTEEDAAEGRFRLPDEQMQEAWYPTLRRTMWVLSRLQGYVNVSSPPATLGETPSEVPTS